MTSRALGLVCVFVLACEPVHGDRNSVDGGGSGGARDSGAALDADTALDGGTGGGTVKPEWVSGTRLRARFMTSSDGAKAFYGWYDTQLRVNCSVMLAGDGQQRCLPSTAAFLSSYFADAACTTQLAQVSLTDTVSCALTLVRAVEQVQRCSDFGFADSRIRLYSISSAFSGTVYQRSGTSCSAYTDMTQFPYTTWRFYRVGAEIPASTYAAITIATE